MAEDLGHHADWGQDHRINLSESIRLQTILSSLPGSTQNQSQSINTLEDLLRHVQILGLRAYSSSELGKLKFIGEGASYKVFGCREKQSGQVVAIKRVKLPSSTNFEAFRHRVASVLRDIEIMKHAPIASHHNVLHIFGYGWDYSQGDTIPYIVTEWAVDGNLRTFLQKKAQKNAFGLRAKLCLCGDIISGLYELHLCGICHGDIKLENILVQRMQYGQGIEAYVAKISDFGHSILLMSEEASVDLYRGTPGYRPPETSRKTTQNMAVDIRKCDLWATGLCVWEILLDGNRYYETLPVTEAVHTAGQSMETLFASESGHDQSPKDGLGTEFENSGHIYGQMSTLASLSVVSAVGKEEEPGWQSCRSQIFVDLLNPDPFKRSSRLFHLPDVWGRMIPRATQLRDQLRPSLTVEQKWDFDTFRPQQMAIIPSSAKKKIFEDFQLLANHKDPQQAARATLHLAYSYATGFGVQQNRDRFQTLVSKAARDGLAIARPLARLVSESRIKLSVDLAIRSYTFFVRHFLRSRSTGPEADLGDHPRSYEDLVQAHLTSARLPGSSLAPPPVSAVHFRISDQIPYGAVVNDQHSLTGETALIVACRCGDHVAVNNLLDRGADISICDNKGTLPLHWLCMFDDVHVKDIAARLTEDWGLQHINRVTTSATIPDFQFPLVLHGTPLAFAVSTCSRGAVQALIDLGADPWAGKNHPTAARSAIEIAISFHLADIFEILCQAHATSQNASDRLVYDYDTLLLAHLLPRSSLIERYLLHGGDVLQALRCMVRALPRQFLPYDSPGPPHALAAAVELSDLSCAELLLDEFYKPDQSVKDGLLFACLRVVCAGIRDHDECVHLLEFALTHGANINAMSPEGRAVDILIQNRQAFLLGRWLLRKSPDLSQAPSTRLRPFHPLYDMIDNGLSSSSSFEGLLFKGADPNESNNLAAQNAFHLAIIKRRLSDVRILLKHGAIPTWPDHEGRSPFHDAVYQRNMELIHIMLPYVKAIDTLNSDQTSPLQIAARGDAHLIVEILLDHGAIPTSGQPSALHIAATSGSSRSLELMMRRSIDVNVLDANGRTPLQAAIQARKAVCVIDLLNAGADPNLHPDGQPSPPDLIIRHFRADRLSLIDLVRQKGGRLDAPGNDGTTLLHLAAYMGDLPLVRYLLNAGLSPAALGHRNQTPLHDCVRWLPAQGREPAVNTVDIDSRSKIIHLLISAGSRIPFKPYSGRSLVHELDEDVRTPTPAKSAQTLSTEKLPGSKLMITNAKSEDLHDPANIFAEYGESRSQESTTTETPSDAELISNDEPPSIYLKEYPNLKKKLFVRSNIALAKERLAMLSSGTRPREWLNQQRDKSAEENRLRQADRENLVTGYGITLLGDSKSQTALDLAAMRTNDVELLKCLLRIHTSIIQQSTRLIPGDITAELRSQNAKEHQNIVTAAWRNAIQSGNWAAVHAFLAEGMDVDHSILQWPAGGRLFFTALVTDNSDILRLFLGQKAVAKSPRSLSPYRSHWPLMPSLSYQCLADLIFVWRQTKKIRKQVKKDLERMCQGNGRWDRDIIDTLNLKGPFKAEMESMQEILEDTDRKVSHLSWYRKAGNRNTLEQIWDNMICTDIQTILWCFAASFGDPKDLHQPRPSSLDILGTLMGLICAAAASAGRRLWTEEQWESLCPQNTAIPIGLICEIAVSPTQDPTRIARLELILEDYRGLVWLIASRNFPNIVHHDIDRVWFERVSEGLKALLLWLEQIYVYELEKDPPAPPSSNSDTLPTLPIGGISPASPRVPAIVMTDDQPALSAISSHAIYDGYS